MHNDFTSEFLSLLLGFAAGGLLVSILTMQSEKTELQETIAEMEASQITLESAAQCKDGGQYPYAGNTDQSIIIFICDTRHTGVPE